LVFLAQGRLTSVSMKLRTTVASADIGDISLSFFSSPSAFLRASLLIARP
jgi:hypothetical protein